VRSTWRLCRRQLRVHGQIHRIDLHPAPTHTVLFWLRMRPQLMLLHLHDDSFTVSLPLRYLLRPPRQLRYWMLMWPVAIDMT
jgi:hypothetical protein